MASASKPLKYNVIFRIRQLQLFKFPIRHKNPWKNCLLGIDV